MDMRKRMESLIVEMLDGRIMGSSANDGDDMDLDQFVSQCRQAWQIFVTGAPTPDEIGAATGRTAEQPIRVVPVVTGLSHPWGRWWGRAPIHRSRARTP